MWWVSVNMALLAVAVLMQLLLPLHGKKTIQVGFMQDFTRIPDFTYPMLSAAMVAVDQINDDPSYTPYFDLSLVVRDTRGDPRGAAFGTLGLIQENNVSVIVGPTFSSPAMASQYVASLFELPQISPTATSSLLDNKNTFPTFMRTNGGSYTDLLAKFIVAMGWRNVAVLTHLNSFSVQETVDFVEHADKMNLIVKLQLDFTVDDYKEKLSALRLSGIRVVILFSYETEAALILEEVHRQNMTVGYQFIGNNDWVRPGALKFHHAVGILGVIPETPTHQRLRIKLGKKKRKTRRDNGKLYAGYTEKMEEVNWGAEASYTAILVFAEAARKVMQKGSTVNNRKLLLQTMKDNKIKTDEGNVVTFSNKTGDRHMNYLIVNGRENGTYSRLAFYSPNKGFSLTADSPIYMGQVTKRPTDMISCNANFYFTNGTCEQCPRNQCSVKGLASTCSMCIVQFKFSRLLKLSLAVIGYLGMGVTIMLAIYLFVRRKNKWIVRSTPPLLWAAVAGAFLVFVYTILMGVQMSTPICITRLWTKYIGFAMIYGALNVKEAHPMVRHNIKLSFLFFAYVLVFVICLAFWSAFHLPRYIAMEFIDDGLIYEYKDCDEGGAGQWAALSHIILVLVWGMLQSFSLRHVPACNHECYYTWITCTLACFIGAGTMIVKIAIHNFPNRSILLDSGFFVLITFIAIFLLFIPKIYKMENAISRNRRPKFKNDRKSSNLGTFSDPRKRSVKSNNRNIASAGMTKQDSLTLIQQYSVDFTDLDEKKYLLLLEVENKGLRRQLEKVKDQFALLVYRQANPTQLEVLGETGVILRNVGFAFPVQFAVSISQVNATLLDVTLSRRVNTTTNGRTRRIDPEGKRKFYQETDIAHLSLLGQDTLSITNDQVKEQKQHRTDFVEVPVNPEVIVSPPVNRLKNQPSYSYPSIGNREQMDRIFQNSQVSLGTQKTREVASENDSDGEGKMSAIEFISEADDSDGLTSEGTPSESRSRSPQKMSPSEGAHRRTGSLSRIANEAATLELPDSPASWSHSSLDEFSKR